MKALRIPWLLSLTSVFFGVALAGQTPIVVPLGGHDLTMTTLSGSASDAVNSFQFETEYGLIKGYANYRNNSATYTLNAPSAAATIEHFGGTAGGPPMITLTVTGHGTASWNVVGGVPILVQNTFADCPSYRDSPFIDAIFSAALSYPQVLDTLDTNDLDSGYVATSQVYELVIRFLTVSPSLLGCDTPVEPYNGVCVFEVGFGACAQCCFDSGNADKFVGVSSGFVALAMVWNPWVSGAAGLMGIIASLPNDCIELICGGKPGDPDPSRCGDEDEGVCMPACPDQNEIVSGSTQCPSLTSCCPNPEYY